MVPLKVGLEEGSGFLHRELIVGEGVVEATLWRSPPVALLLLDTVGAAPGAVSRVGRVPSVLWCAPHPRTRLILRVLVPSSAGSPGRPRYWVVAGLVLSKLGSVRWLWAADWFSSQRPPFYPRMAL